MTVKYSLEGLVKEGTIKRARAGLQVPYKNLVPIWNARDHDEDWEEKITDLVKYLRNGGTVPAIEIHINESNGNIEIVEGYRRHEAYGRLIAEGLPVDLINIVQFKGSKEDRIARIVTSNNQVELKPLEMAKVYKQLSTLNMTPAQIAEKVHKSRPHVDGYLLLANANHDVQELVRSKLVSADTAINCIREHGEKAGVFLQEALQKRGGKKITMGSIKGKSLPKKIATGYLASADTLAISFGTEVHTKLYEITQAKKERGEEIADEDLITVQLSAKALGVFLESHGDAEAVRAKQAEKQRLREAKAAQGELGGGSHG
jgi:ParB/RepB/Spo0J family partition protein